ncbi:MAG: isopeptide-forming domain-containing fimbrial protein [Ruminococcus sp.]
MKNTKRARRAAAFAAAVVMAACAAVPMSSSFSASAAGNNTITITAVDGAAITHNYEAYQVFKGQYAAGSLGNIDWGTGVDGTAILAELQSAAAPLDVFNGAKDAKDVAEKLAAGVTKADDDTLAVAFAAVVGKHLTAVKSGTYANGEITGLDDGYYLVQDASDSPSGTGETNSGAKTRFILKVAGGGNVNVTAKSSAPSVIKKVKEDDKTVTGAVTVGAYTANAQYNDVADYCIGENVPFELISTMPSTYDDYTSYFYQFTDTLASNFTLNTNSIAVKVVNADGETPLTATDYTVSSQDESGKFTITINDTKKITSIKKDSTIVVDYNATLNDTAEIGLPGQENKVDLTYSNNPNYTGDGASTPEGDKGKTPEDKVIVFTYELDVTKYLGNEETKADAEDGTKAGFKLGNADGSKWATVDGNLRITGWVDDVAAATEVTTDATGIFKFIGLDDGKYTLRETTTPTGYNTMADLTLTIGATTANNQVWSGTASDALSAIKLTMNSTNIDGDVDKGNVEGSIINQKGSSLPSTGGIGTTMFYVGGGVLVAGAGVLLITKKRAKKDAE